jgi:hypothetical protein
LKIYNNTPLINKFVDACKSGDGIEILGEKFYVIAFSFHQNYDDKSSFAEVELVNYGK